ncbi:MAG: neutral/alkaline non-lysosomal ceramidase N-terminal domain-containing protein [Litorilinea sp.]
MSEQETAAAARGHLQAGVARADITPPVGIAHANWGAQAHEQAQGVDLPLWATALALSDGATTTVVVDLDISGLRPENATAVRAAIAQRTGLPVAYVRLAYTHTHSGPSTSSSGGWVKGGIELIPGYLESVAAQCAGAAWEACNCLQPARIAAGTGHSAIAVNRRYVTPDQTVVVGHNWDGPVDHEIKVVRIDDLNEQPLAVLVNYACHPIIVGPYNDLITPDYPGIMKRVVEEATGAKCLFLQGATGDIGPIEGCTSPTPRAVYRKLGKRLGYAAATVALDLDPAHKVDGYVHTLESGAPLGVFEYTVPPAAPVTLRVATRPVQIPLKEHPPFEVADAEARAHADELQRLRREGTEDEVRWAGMLAKRSRSRAERARAYHGKTHMEWELHGIRINDIALVGMPGEPFVEIGLAVKAGSPFAHTLFAGYSNVGSAYIPMPDAYAVGGYEVDSTPFTADAAQVLVEESLALLADLQE